MTESLKRNSKTLTEGPDRAPARAMLRAVGLVDEDFNKPLIASSQHLVGVTPLQLSSPRSSRQHQTGHSRGWGHTDRIQHDRGLGWHQHGHRRHESLPHQPGGRSPIPLNSLSVAISLTESLPFQAVTKPSRDA